MKTFSFVLGIVALVSSLSVWAESDHHPEDLTKEPTTAQVQMMDNMKMDKMDSKMMKDMMTPEMMESMMEMMSSPMHQKMMQKEMMNNTDSQKNTWKNHHPISNNWNIGWHFLMAIFWLVFLAVATFIIRKAWNAAGKK